MSSWNKYTCCIPRRTMIGFSCGQLQSIVGSSTQEAISMDWIGGWIHLLAQICRGSQKIVSKSKSFVSCFSFKLSYIYIHTHIGACKVYWTYLKAPEVHCLMKSPKSLPTEEWRSDHLQSHLQWVAKAHGAIPAIIQQHRWRDLQW